MGQLYSNGGGTAESVSRDEQKQADDDAAEMMEIQPWGQCPLSKTLPSSAYLVMSPIFRATVGS